MAPSPLNTSFKLRWAASLWPVPLGPVYKTRDARKYCTVGHFGKDSRDKALHATGAAFSKPDKPQAPLPSGPGAGDMLRHGF